MSNNPTGHCRPATTYQQMLRSHLPAHEADEVRNHVEQCPHCSALVGDLAQEMAASAPNELQFTVVGGGARPITATEAHVSSDPAPVNLGNIGQLGQYRILEALGAGGMGVVFLAEDTQLHRRVAIKVMQPSLATSPEATQRFLREARLMASLKHDHVVTVHQVGTVHQDGQKDDLVYLVMELLEGEPLKKRMFRERIPLGEIVRIGHQMALGLAGAHKVGLIHRDVKPDNVWLEAPTGRVKILDFGLARAAVEDARLTQTGVFVGTPAYVSPEQARGEPVDARGDLFSLGCVLYEMCTGQLPFRGQTAMATIIAVTTQSPEPIRQVNPKLPTPLGELIMRLLAKKPEERPQSAQAVADALAAMMAPRSRPQEARVSRTFAIVFLLLVLAAGVAAYFFAQRGLLHLTGQAEVVVAPGNKVESFEMTVRDAQGKAVSEGIEPRRKLEPGSYFLEVSARDDKGLTMFSKEVTLARGDSITLDLPTEIEIANQPDPRQKDLGVLGLDGQMRHPSGTVLGLSFSSDSKMLASSGDDHVIRLWEPEKGKELLSIAGHNEEVNAVAFSPKNDGRLASASADRTVKVWQVRTGAREQQVSSFQGDQQAAFTSLAFDAEARYLAAGNTAGVVHLWDTHSPQPKARTRNFGVPIRSVAFSSDGLLGAACNDGTFKVYSVGRWEELLTKEAHSKRVQELTFHPSGKLLATGGFDKVAFLWDARSGKAKQMLTNAREVSSVCFSPDGNLLATAGLDQTIRLWRTGTGEEVLYLKRGGQVVRFSPDGRWLAAGGLDGFVRVWDVSKLKKPAE